MVCLVVCVYLTGGVDCIGRRRFDKEGLRVLSSRRWLCPEIAESGCVTTMGLSTRLGPLISISIRGMRYPPSVIGGRSSARNGPMDVGT